MLDDLPKAYTHDTFGQVSWVYNIGSMRTSKGNTSHWIGYKLHIEQLKFISTVIKLGHTPIIDINPRRNKSFQLELKAENKRCRIIN